MRRALGKPKQRGTQPEKESRRQGGSNASGTHHDETAECARTRNHYGAATEEPGRAITSAPTTPTTRVVASPEKARPRRTYVGI
jgi:hypothetical protein